MIVSLFYFHQAFVRCLWFHINLDRQSFAAGEKIYFLVQTELQQEKKSFIFWCKQCAVNCVNTRGLCGSPRFMGLRAPGESQAGPSWRYFYFWGSADIFRKNFPKNMGFFPNGEGNEFGKLFFLGAMVPFGHWVGVACNTFPWSFSVFSIWIN